MTGCCKMADFHEDIIYSFIHYFDLSIHLFTYLFICLCISFCCWVRFVFLLFVFQCLASFIDNVSWSTACRCRFQSCPSRMTFQVSFHVCINNEKAVSVRSAVTPGCNASGTFITQTNMEDTHGCFSLFHSFFSLAVCLSYLFIFLFLSPLMLK